MDALKLSFTLLTRDKKNSIIYLISSVTTFTILFGIFNIIYDVNLETKITEEFYVFTRILLALVLFLVILIGYFSNNFFMEKRKKEIGIELISGLSLNSLAFSSAAINTVFSIVSLLISLGLVFFISPVLNSFLYTLAGIENATFEISLNGITSAFAMVFINIMLLGLVNVGLGYRTEICDLVRSKSGSYKQKKEGTFKKIFGITVFILSILCLGYIIIENSNDAIGLFASIGILFFILTCKNTLPRFFRKIGAKAKNHNNSIIFNNIAVDLEKSTIALVTSGTIVGFLCYILVCYKIDRIATITCIGSILLMLVLFIIGSLYTVNSLATLRFRNFKILKTLGYSKKDVNDIILKEISIYLSLITIVPNIYMIICLFRYTSLGIIPSNIKNILLIFIIITFVVLSVFSYFIYFKSINSHLYKEEEHE